jgi:hypothetical protein
MSCSHNCWQHAFPFIYANNTSCLGVVVNITRCVCVVFPCIAWIAHVKCLKMRDMTLSLAFMFCLIIPARHTRRSVSRIGEWSWWFSRQMSVRAWNRQDDLEWLCPQFHSSSIAKHGHQFAFLDGVHLWVADASIMYASTEFCLVNRLLSFRHYLYSV